MKNITKFEDSFSSTSAQKKFSVSKANCCNSLPNSINPDVDFTNSMLNNVRFSEHDRVFKLFHLQGLHSPRVIDEHFRHDPALNEDTSSIPSSGIASLKMLFLFFDELKKSTLYSNALIFVLSDHGLARTVNPSKSALHDELNKKSLRLGFNAVKGSAIPLVLVKPPNSAGQLKVSEAPVELSDVPNTVMALSGRSQSFPGIPFFSQKQKQRERLFWVHAYHEKDYDYYGDLQEFLIRGNVYDDSAWSITGKLLKPVKTSIGEIYKERDVFLKKMLPLKVIQQRGEVFSIPPYGFLDDAFNAHKAFDKIPRETGWMPVERPNGKCADEAILGVRYSDAVSVKAYSITTRFDLQYQAPKSWTFEASNDNKVWSVLHKIEEEVGWEPQGKPKFFHLSENNQKFLQYRINISQGQHIGKCIFIDEFELFSLPESK